MARLLGVSQPTVWNWVKKDLPLPAEHVLAVEAATGISRHDLRPDIYPRDESKPESGTCGTASASARPLPADAAQSDAAQSAPDNPLQGLRA